MGSEQTSYKCVHCGEPAEALYKRYGPSVLKLTKCETCRGTVDNYVEYDPVIVMIDLILMSREAQRHVIYNTEFKPYWKIFIILMLLETYGVWRNDSIINVTVRTLCDLYNNHLLNSSHIIISSTSSIWLDKCSVWREQEKIDTTDLFIWEKNFYILFISIFAGIATFIATAHLLMDLFSSFIKSNSVSFRTLVKAFSLANVSLLLTLPNLVWGSHIDNYTHYLLVFGYMAVVFINVITVVYGCPLAVSVLVLFVSMSLKYITTFATVPFVRQLLS